MKRLLLVILLPVLAGAMESNLARPWGDGCSRPHNSDLVFTSCQAPEMLFPAVEQLLVDCRVGKRVIGLTWTLARNRFRASFREGVGDPSPANTFRIVVDTDGLYPGFYDLRVAADTGLPKPVTGICTFGYRVDDIPLTTNRPADLAAFWDTAKAEIGAVPLDAREEDQWQTFDAAAIGRYNVENAALPADYDPTGHRAETVESVKVSFAGPAGGRVYGWLARPVGEGPFPVLLVLPGAGYNARPRPLEHARHGYLALDIQIHGQDVDLDEYERLPGYQRKEHVYEPVEAHYFRHVFQRVLQAINYLASRPDADIDRLAVCGGSQGGYLSIVAPALDPRIRAAVPAITAFGYVSYQRWVEEAGKDGTGMDRAAPPMPPDTPEYRCRAYYDPANLAPDIRCPVFMNSGLIDPISPAAQVWAVYLQVGSADKTLVPLPGLGHDWSAEFDRRAWRWLEDKLR